MNIENMKRLLTHLELDGQKFHYGCFIGERREDEYDGSEIVNDDEIPSDSQTLSDLYHCKGETVGCLAGMATAIALVEDNFSVQMWESIDPLVTAQRWLDLDDSQRIRLFYGGAMSEIGLYSSPQKALANATPLDAAKVVQHWIDTEGAGGSDVG